MPWASIPPAFVKSPPTYKLLPTESTARTLSFKPGAIWNWESQVPFPAPCAAQAHAQHRSDLVRLPTLVNSKPSDESSNQRHVLRHFDHDCAGDFVVPG